MAKPVILCVDDEPNVLRAVERDLRNKYGEDFRILRASSGEIALNAVQELALRNEVVAVFVVDQRMPEMTGAEFLEAAIQYFPEAKRVLLTAYADNDAAIRLINNVGIDHYLIKPWSPPEERFYPVLDELIEGWIANYVPPFDGIRIVGHRWSAKTHQLKDFLARNHVPYRWLNIETSNEAQELLRAANTDGLPVVALADGTLLSDPALLEVAYHIGLQTEAELPFYDLVIVGGGPAGLAAAVYGASEGLKTVVIEREAPGGQAGMSSRIENYLGFSGISGGELARRALAQAKKFNAEILSPQEVMSIKDQGSSKIITLRDGQEITARTVLIASGVAYRRLDVEGVDRLAGAGVYYGAAMTEAIACREEKVYVVGGANSAGQAAMYLSKYAAKVTMLVRGDSLVDTMSKYLIDQIEATENIVVRYCAEIVGVEGEESLQSITVRDMRDNRRDDLPAQALFIFIGALPNTDWLGDLVARDEQGFILSGTDLMPHGRMPRRWGLERIPYYLETSVPGIFVCGDVRSGSVKRVASGVGEGAMAIQFVHKYMVDG